MLKFYDKFVIQPQDDEGGGGGGGAALPFFTETITGTVIESAGVVEQS